MILSHTERERKRFSSFASVPHSLISNSQRNGKVEHETITNFEKMSREQENRKSTPKDSDAIAFTVSLHRKGYAFFY